MHSIQELKDLSFQIESSHNEILDSLDRMQNDLHFYARVKPHLRILQQRLLAHFGRQNEERYHQLSLRFIEDEGKLKKLDFLVHDARDIKIKMLTFFDAHPADLSDQKPGNFVRDFTVFSQELMARIGSEKEYLLPLLKTFS